MTVSELLNTYSAESMIEWLSYRHHLSQPTWEKLFHSIHDLQTTTPLPNPDRWVLVVDPHAREVFAAREGRDEAYSVDLDQWPKVLGYTILVKLRSGVLMSVETAATVVWELTLWGWTTDEVATTQRQLDALLPTQRLWSVKEMKDQFFPDDDLSDTLT